MENLNQLNRLLQLSQNNMTSHALASLGLFACDKLLKFFTISVILIKIGKQSDFHPTYFQIVGP